MRFALLAAMLFLVGCAFPTFPAEEVSLTAAEKPADLVIILRGDRHGDLQEIVLNGAVLPEPKDSKRSKFDLLEHHVRKLVTVDGQRKPGEVKALVQVESAGNLRYGYVTQTIEVLTGKSDTEERLVDSISLQALPAAIDAPAAQ